MSTLLLCSASSIDLESLSKAVPDAYDSSIEDHAIRRLSIRHCDGGLIVQICEEDEEGNGDIMDDLGGVDGFPDPFMALMKQRSLHFVLCSWNSNYRDDGLKVIGSYAEKGCIEFVIFGENRVVEAGDFEGGE